MRVSILVHNVYGVGGTNRTVINLADGLVQRGHKVEIVSILRRLDEPMLAVPAGVALVPLVDLRPHKADRDDSRGREMSAVVPIEEEFARFYSRLTDERIAAHLARSRSDVVIGTRTALNLYVARSGRPGTVRIAQEHMTQSLIPESVRAEMRRHYGVLDAVVTVTEADATAVRDTLGPGGPPVSAVPNSVPAPAVAPADGASKIIVAAGRLDSIKRYDLLVRAFARVVEERPDWRLRIYGSGNQFGRIRALAADLDLHNHVQMMGSYAPLEAEWVKGSIAAVTSDHESFGMTIVEAMRCGVPVVSTDCPVGPREIIRHGVDGLLVPTGDVDAIADGLLQLINDDSLRVRLGRAALENSRRYDPLVVSGMHESLFGGGTTPLSRMRDKAGRLLAGLRRSSEAAPVADCTMTGNRIVVSAPDASHLLFRARADKRTVLLPLSDGTAEFDADGTLLDEGRWDLFLSDRAGLRTRRLRAGLLDVRGLLSSGSSPGPFARNVPYRTADGHLAVGVWRRERHAEFEDIGYGEDVITVRGRLIGSSFGGAAPELVLTRRGDHPATLAVAGTSDDDGDFAADVPLAELAALRLLRHEDWDVEVRPAGGGWSAPVARLMDDIIERKKVFVYPPMRVDDEPPLELYEESPRPEVRVKPYCTVNSGLSFIMSDRA
ncbi:glycosyltransferase family 4 protein [Actinoplanes sp. NBRC 103695]|uniref:glycosyltransferase family 4 protein n=1 Tax=Actinoplanes sp. NBRC 103695 TaxID=3032202 RepID=UPI0024A45938|nr:glycosyltransferase family 4 protein [Actinoplanes sp. NBRC 103695]GLY94474.1 glycosyl transferase family 1 [Actinoplanes sp. NBRC 103695]